jgi:hypothetical protein
LEFFLENEVLNEKVSEQHNGPYRLVAWLKAEATNKMWGVPFDVYADEGNAAEPTSFSPPPCLFFPLDWLCSR